jgi:predicted nucleotidyltransferase
MWLCEPGEPGDANFYLCYGVIVLPEFSLDGDLPVGVHIASWQEFRARLGAVTSRRVWLTSRLEALVELATKSGKLRRIFVWGSFVTAKPNRRDLDILLIMDEDFEVERIPLPAQAVFDSVRAKLLFESDVFWSRASIGEEVLQLWLETYQTSRTFRKRGIVELELL